MVFTFRNRLKIIIQQSMPATSNISNISYFKTNMIVILTILLFLYTEDDEVFTCKSLKHFHYWNMLLFFFINRWFHHSVYLPLSSISFYLGYSLYTYILYLLWIADIWFLILKKTHFRHSFTCWFISLHLATSMMVWSFSRPSLTAYVC